MSAVMKQILYKTSKVAKNQYEFPVLDLSQLINDSFYNITL